MKGKKERLETFIKEELEEEAEEIRRENAADEEGQSMPAEAKERIWQKIQGEIADYERNASYKALSDEDYRALCLGREILENKGDEKKAVRKKKRIRFYLGLAAVFVFVLAVSVTSFGGPERVVRFLKGTVGEREITKVNSSEDNLVIVEENEEEAYQVIADEFGIEPVKINKCPQGMHFDSMELDKNIQFAELTYIYSDESIAYFIGAFYRDTSWGTDVEDKMINEYQMEKKGCFIDIKEYELAEGGKKRYLASFEYKNFKYFLAGTMEKDEFELIIKNLYFIA